MLKVGRQKIQGVQKYRVADKHDQAVVLIESRASPDLQTHVHTRTHAYTHLHTRTHTYNIPLPLPTHTQRATSTPRITLCIRGWSLPSLGELMRQTLHEDRSKLFHSSPTDVAPRVPIHAWRSQNNKKKTKKLSGSRDSP